MTDIDDVVDFSGAPAQPLSDDREHGFQIMKARMLQIKQGQVSHLSPMLRGTALKFYAMALDDAFNVFRQVVEQPQTEELTPG